MIFGKSAEAYEAKNNGYLQQRNDAIATDLWNQQKITEKDVSDYLKQYEEFNNYELSGQQNTIQAIYKRLGELQSQNGVPSGTTA
ncbi:MAG: hypothetical protein LBG59_07575 [Candidatus Peribacteria bacterium]|jgi:hypothetical protein|nr:hypothetical protein [Candidatus Peribacteria bacterium]